ncbi:hypothetical protein Mp_3g09500 [Marchantia polymorpha subsp. ruderalis]|uniref:Uncharacterized protein n=2 Tax=Marchantia polymorpha TaxID=3197 RepID=A0AAF6AZ25_MARPO|nr:hypothetical protein MARPO_0085s0077 [Marchantia polymorpha]BBN05009.1 hypothetical protein Mp_3g09500 [Marchantia polymorpha subsp. ruderalis]|eukprot:PTQ33867.1 hypothetical protein MARPO_0085s0077 [Marchantia polymorpha]
MAEGRTPSTTAAAAPEPARLRAGPYRTDERFGPLACGRDWRAGWRAGGRSMMTMTGRAKRGAECHLARRPARRVRFRLPGGALTVPPDKRRDPRGPGVAGNHPPARQSRHALPYLGSIALRRAEGLRSWTCWPLGPEHATKPRLLCQRSVVTGPGVVPSLRSGGWRSPGPILLRLQEIRRAPLSSSTDRRSPDECSALGSIRPWIGQWPL